VGGMRSLRSGRRQSKGILLRKWLCGWQVAILWCSVQHTLWTSCVSCLLGNHLSRPKFRVCFQSFPTNTGFESF